MAHRTRVINYMSDLGFPFGLPQIIADYAILPNALRLDELFRVNGGKYIFVTSSMPDSFGVLTLICLDDGIVDIACAIGECSCRHHWTNMTTSAFIARGAFDTLLPFYQLSDADIQVRDHLIDQITQMWHNV